MNIWYIHHYGGGPGLGHYDRPYQLARAWQRQGHSATIFIARFHHLLDEHAAPASEFDIDGVQYVSLPARWYSNNGFARLGNVWDFSRNLYAVGKRWGRDMPHPDAIIASSPHPFSAIPAYHLARRYSAKFVFEIRDIWPLSITEILGTPRWHPFVQLCAATERFAFNRSDLIASVLPRANQYLIDRGYSAKPFVWVPNGVLKREPGAVSSSFRSEAATLAAKFALTWRAKGAATVIYTGSIGQPNALDVIVQAAAYARSSGDDARFAVLIVGRGDQMKPLKAFVRERGLENIHFSGPVPKADAVRLLDHVDIGYAGLRNIDGLFKYGISPNKIADYLNAGLPVLLPLAACGDPVSQSGGGVARKAETPEAVWKALRELVVISDRERRAMGEKGRAYIRRIYDYDMIARRYAKVIAEL